MTEESTRNSVVETRAKVNNYHQSAYQFYYANSHKLSERIFVNGMGNFIENRIIRETADVSIMPRTRQILNTSKTDLMVERIYNRSGFC